MASEIGTPPSAEIIGSMFVNQYYQILHESPESVYKFYHDSSVISRPDCDGEMTSVTTMKKINEKIMSMDYLDSKVEIKTADSQKSRKNGVFVLVTGCLRGNDNFGRNFTQSFYLAPQKNGYFVRNDIFQYVGDGELKSNSVTEDKSETVPLTQNPGWVFLLLFSTVMSVHKYLNSTPPYMSPEFPLVSSSPAAGAIPVEDSQFDEETHETENSAKNLANDAVFLNLTSPYVSPESPLIPNSPTPDPAILVEDSQFNEKTRETENSAKNLANDAVFLNLTSPYVSPESPLIPNSAAPDPAIPLEDSQFDEKSHETADSEKKLANDTVVIVKVQFSTKDATAESASSAAEEDAPKQSYASILGSESEISNSHQDMGTLDSGHPKIHIPASSAKMAVVKAEKQPGSSLTTSPRGNQNSREEVDGHSIFVRNLPVDITPDQLELAFEKFGPIKKGGIQVRSHKHLGNCFGFVEFESVASMNDAIQASPICIGHQEAVVEMKKTTTRGGVGRAWFPPGRGLLKNDSFRDIGNLVGHARNEYGQGDFSGRGSRGPSGRRANDYQQGRGRGRGRVNRRIRQTPN